MSCLFYSKEILLLKYWLKKEKVEQKQLKKKTFKYKFLGGRFHMLPRHYKFTHRICLNNLPQVLLIVSQSDQVTPFIYINCDDEVSNLVDPSARK